MTTKFIGTKELRQDMAKITKNAQKKNERIIVLRKNKPVFELRPLSDEDALVESFAHDVARAKKQAKDGDVCSQEQIFKELGL